MESNPHLAASQGHRAISLFTLFRGQVEYPRSIRNDRILGSAAVDTRSSLPQISYIGGTLEISPPVTSQFPTHTLSPPDVCIACVNFPACALNLLSPA